jgi:putative acetyltransferase
MQGIGVGIEFRVDDLSGAEVQALVARHLKGMHASSPACSVHAFDIDRLKQPGVTFWSAWVDGQLAAMGALKALGGGAGEIKSMRVDDAFLGRGMGRAMLNHILAEARRAGMTSLWLETGSTPDFEPALKLYESAGFAFCGPFGDYKLDPFSRFMTRVV